MINIFQFLKQGTSLNRQSLASNQFLQGEIIAKDRQPNHHYQQNQHFNPSDSEEEPEPSTTDQHLITAFRNRKTNKSIELCKHNTIKSHGLDCPLALANFTKMIKKYRINEKIILGLEEMGFNRPTPVQMQVIPCLLEKRNIIVTAPTGTGKTVSFLLPILANLKETNKITAIIMAPIQELATQILHQLSILAKFTNITFRCSSKLSEDEKKKIKANKSPGFNILVTTPLSFLHTFDQSTKVLKHVEYIVLDQCDKYFEESFLDQIKLFLQYFSKAHPTYSLFSATIQHPVEELLKTEFLDDCIRIEIGGNNKVLSSIEQSMEYCTNQLGKLIYLRNIILEGLFIPPVLIFVQEKQRAKQLYFQLKKIMAKEMNQSKRIQLISSSKSKEERQEILNHFDQGKYWALITTDIVARGIDFRNVNLVINYDFPNSMLTYIHRVGRTGRADKTGKAITFFTEEDKPMVRSLANLLKSSGCIVPEWICSMKKINKKKLKQLQKYPVRRLAVGKAEGKDKEWEQELEVMSKKWQKVKREELEKDKRRKQKSGDGWVQVGPEQ